MANFWWVLYAWISLTRICQFENELNVLIKQLEKVKNSKYLGTHISMLNFWTCFLSSHVLLESFLWWKRKLNLRILRCKLLWLFKKPIWTLFSRHDLWKKSLKLHEDLNILFSDQAILSFPRTSWRLVTATLSRSTSSPRPRGSLKSSSSKLLICSLDPPQSNSSRSAAAVSEPTACLLTFKGEEKKLERQLK